MFTPANDARGGDTKSHWQGAQRVGGREASGHVALVSQRHHNPPWLDWSSTTDTSTAADHHYVGRQQRRTIRYSGNGRPTSQLPLSDTARGSTAASTVGGRRKLLPHFPLAPWAYRPLLPRSPLPQPTWRCNAGQPTGCVCTSQGRRGRGEGATERGAARDGAYG